MKKVFIALFGLSFAATAFSAEEKKGKPAGKPAGERISDRANEIGDDLNSYSSGSYGMAGCGLGTMVIKDNSFVQIFASTTNGTSGNQTFGITSGTSNCVGRSKNSAQEQKVFIESNYASLMKEAAQGGGTHIQAFAELLGCDHAEFANYSKANYENIFSSSNPEDVVDSYRKNFGDRCTRIRAS